jgi:hypothetical protein
MTNGTELLPGIDRRSPAARRFRDLWLLFLSDMGGESEASEGEKAILRSAALLTAQLELYAADIIQALDNNERPPIDVVDLFQRMSNTARRHLETVGLKRRPKDVTPELHAYLADAPKRPDATDAETEDA